MHLRVVIKNVRHLPKMDVLGTCDPYVVLSFGNQKYQTSTKYNTYNPDYEEEFLFNVDDTNATEILTIDLIDWDRLTEHDYIGSVQLDLSSIISSLGDAGDSLEKTCHLRNLRDSSATAVKGNDGSPTTLTLSFSSEDVVKSVSSTSASGNSFQSQDDKVLVEKVVGLPVDRETMNTYVITPRPLISISDACRLCTFQYLLCHVRD